MGLFDVGGFGSTEIVKEEKQENTENKTVFKENSFDRSISEEINPIIKMKVINKHYNLGQILKSLGKDINSSNIYCPFHPDSMTGKASAKYYPDSDLLYCFSENKLYSAYHAIKLIYGIDTDKVFMDIWSKMSLAERHYYMDTTKEVSYEVDNKTWTYYRDNVLDKFRKREVNFVQYKNALYKVLKILNQSDKEEK